MLNRLLEEEDHVLVLFYSRESNKKKAQERIQQSSLMYLIQNQIFGVDFIKFG